MTLGDMIRIISAGAGSRIEIMTKNVNIFDVDENGGIYMVTPGKKNVYELRKYNSELELLWVNKVYDGMLEVLSSEPEIFPDEGRIYC